MRARAAWAAALQHGGAALIAIIAIIGIDKGRAAPLYNSVSTPNLSDICEPIIPKSVCIFDFTINIDGPCPPDGFIQNLHSPRLIVGSRFADNYAGASRHQRDTRALVHLGMRHKSRREGIFSDAHSNIGPKVVSWRGSKIFDDDYYLNFVGSYRVLKSDGFRPDISSQLSFPSVPSSVNQRPGDENEPDSNKNQKAFTKLKPDERYFWSLATSVLCLGIGWGVWPRIGLIGPLLILYGVAGFVGRFDLFSVFLMLR